MKKRFEAVITYEIKSIYQLEMVIEANSSEEALEKINELHSKNKLYYDESICVAEYEKEINNEQTYVTEVKIEDSKKKKNK